MKVRISIEQIEERAWIKRILQKYHFDDKDFETLINIYKQLLMHMSPYAIYKLNHRTTGISMIDDSQAAMVALTLGSGVDSMKERFTRQGQLAEAYMLDCIANECLLEMYREFNKNYVRFHRRYVQRYVFIGDEISSTKIQSILEDIKGIKRETIAEEEGSGSEHLQEVLREQEDIYANEYGVLTPSKSVVFYALLSEDPKQICEGICMGCGNTRCENRMVEHRQLQGIAEKETNKKSPQGAMNYGYMRIFGA